MKAVLHVGAARHWTQALGPVPWPLVPLGNRPLLEYWFELSVDLGVTDVHLILGDGAEQIEVYAGDGSQWGLHIQYGFLREEHSPLSFLERDRGQWASGLLFVSGPLFPRRLAKAALTPPATDGLYLHPGASGSVCAVCPDATALAVLLKSGGSGGPALPVQYAYAEAQMRPGRSFHEIGFELVPVESTQDFFAINMQLAGGEISRYLAPGYGAADGSLVGYNVIIPPSVEVAPSVIIGNDCRVAALASVGPCAVIGDHVVIDRQAQLTRCVVLAGTYVGCQVELREKIVSACRLIDPEDGEFLDLEDTWLLAGIQPTASPVDIFRAVAGWVLALLLVCVELMPFALFYGWLRMFNRGRLKIQSVYGRRHQVQPMRVFCSSPDARESMGVRVFYALGLDLTPRLWGVVCGQWWLCGHEPLRAPQENALRVELTAYFPAVFSYATAETEKSDPTVAAMEARYYAKNRGILEDISIVRKAFARRWMSVWEAKESHGHGFGDR